MFQKPCQCVITKNILGRPTLTEDGLQQNVDEPATFSLSQTSVDVARRLHFCRHKARLAQQMMIEPDRYSIGENADRDLILNLKQLLEDLTLERGH